jgi:hypothetical protein
MRLEAVSRKLVAKVSRRSTGALVMDNARGFPLSSISGGSTPVNFRELAGLEIESRRPFQFKRQRL